MHDVLLFSPKINPLYKNLYLFSAYLCLDELHPLFSSVDNGTRNVYQSVSSNLVEDIVNGDVSACATNTSTAVDEDGSFGWLMLGLHSTVEPKNGCGIFWHSMIGPGSEVILSGLQVLFIAIYLKKKQFIGKALKRVKTCTK